MQMDVRPGDRLQMKNRIRAAARNFGLAGRHGF